MSRGITNDSTVSAKAKLLGGMMQKSASISTKGAGVELLGVDHRAIDIGEDFETAADADVIAVTRHAIRDHAGPVRFLGKRLDGDFFLDLPIREQAHGGLLQKVRLWIQCMHAGFLKAPIEEQLPFLPLHLAEQHFLVDCRCRGVPRIGR